MPALGVQGLVAIPLQRDVEERALAHVVVPREKARARVPQHVAGRQMLAQVHREIEPARLQLAGKSHEILNRQFARPQLGASVEERELDEFVDRRFEAGEGFRRRTGQNANLRLWKQTLQTPDRRQRGDEIADMVEFHDQDAPDVVRVEQRVPGMHQLHGFVVHPIVVGLTRQIRIEIRVPSGEPRLPMAFEMRQVVNILQPFPAGEFVVNQRGIRRVDRQQARLVGTQAKIEVVVDDLVRLIEPPETVENVAAH